MKNFLRSLRCSWPYRRRLAASIVCALLAALFWSLNLSIILPVMTVLLNPQKSLQAQLDESIDERQKDYDRTSEELKVRVQQLRQTETLPVGKFREDEERKLTGAIAHHEAKLSWISRENYWRQILKTRIVRFLPTDRFETLVWMVVGVVIAVFLRGIFEFWQESLVGSVMNLTLFDLRNRFFRSAIHLDVRQFGEDGTHDLMARFTNDMETLGQGIKTIYGKVVAEPLKAVGCIVCACYFSWQLTALFLVLVPAALLVFSKVGRMMKRASRRLMERISNIYRILQETMNGIRVVKAFTTEARERLRFRNATRDYYVRAMQVVNLDALTGPIVELLGVAAVSVALLAGAYLVVQEETHLFGMRMTEYRMDLATLVQLYALLLAISDPVRKLSSVYTKIQSGAAAADRIFSCLDRQPRIAANSQGTPLPLHAESIEFRNVCFSYEPGRPALSGVDLTFRFGETVALVGKNGCGKTTLVGMLPRFHDPDHGSVFIDGIDVRAARLRNLRRQVGLVTQDTVLFDDTVHNNIAYGKRWATADAVEAAAKKAFLHDFIEKLPHGYQTRLGEAGMRLSGGQRQRIALARAILRNPRILVLDEFTSQCDAESEALIHQALREFMHGRTTFIITHRLNTLEIADRIVVLDRGRVEAVGTHADLLATCAVYQRLHEAHFQRRVA